jgi:hypothetical protein
MTFKLHAHTLSSNCALLFKRIINHGQESAGYFSTAVRTQQFDLLTAWRVMSFFKSKSSSAVVAASQDPLRFLTWNVNSWPHRIGYKSPTSKAMTPARDYTDAQRALFAQYDVICITEHWVPRNGVTTKTRVPPPGRSALEHKFGSACDINGVEHEGYQVAFIACSLLSTIARLAFPLLLFVQSHSLLFNRHLSCLCYPPLTLLLFAITYSSTGHTTSQRQQRACV